METLAKAATSTTAMAAVILVAACAPLARGQGCPAPPENQPFSTFEEWRAVCSRYGTPHGTTLHNAHCDYDPNWCHRNETSPAPARPPNTYEAEREAAIAREKAVEAERLRRIAEERRKQQEFEKEKADALRSLKGVSADDLGLKGGSPDDLGLKDVDAGGVKGDNSPSFDLKDVRATPVGSGPSEINRIYWRTVSVPAACVVAGELKAGDACFVVDM